MSVKKHWWKDASIYELYIDKFAGTIANLTTRLDYFEKLGINALHLLPHYPSPMVDGGYDVMDYLNVRPELGTLDDFDALIVAAHEKGIKIIVDFVLNHVSEHHPWFIEARSSRHNSKRDYFLWSESGREYAHETNSFPHIKPSNWIRNEPTGDYYFATFYSEQPDLNWRNEEVVEAMLAHMDFWADRGVDGFRLDATSHLIKYETKSQDLAATHAILKRLRKHLDTKYGGSIVLLAEAHRQVEEIKTFFGNGDECHLAYNFPMAEALFDSLMRRDTKPMELMLERSRDIPHSCAWAYFLRNHDEISFSTVAEEDRAALLHFLDPKRQYLFRHKRDTAVRLGSIFEKEPERIFDALELLYSLPGAIIMYYGDEIGMRNLPPEDGVLDSRAYVRGDFDWDEAERAVQDPSSLWNRISKHVHYSKASPLTRLILKKPN